MRALARRRQGWLRWAQPVLVVAFLVVAVAYLLPELRSMSRARRGGGSVGKIGANLGAGAPAGEQHEEPALTEDPTPVADEGGPPPVADEGEPSPEATDDTPAEEPVPAVPSTAATGRTTKWIDWPMPPGTVITTAKSLSIKTHPLGQPPHYNPGDTAFVTMATGNDAARLAIVLIQSLRDVGTSPDHDIVVLVVRGAGVAPECLDAAWMKARGREGIDCKGPHTVAEELIAEPYVRTLERLGAKLRVIDPIPSTQYTDGIAGGRQTFWGMSLNRMVIWNMTEYKKVVWMDGDTIVVRNVDHLFNYPTFTSSVTHACCSQNGYGLPSGGIWVLEPHLELGLFFWRLMLEGWVRGVGEG